MTEGECAALQLLESGEMYLESILVLSQKRESVRAIDVSLYMGYSKPSVSRALGILKRGGYVMSDADGYLSLTDAGRGIAEKIYERHRVLSSLLERLGVTPSVAAQDACRIEHDISDETFDAIKRHIQAVGNPADYGYPATSGEAAAPGYPAASDT